MAVSSLDLQAAVDRYMNYAGRGRLMGLPTMSQSCTLATGVPTNGIQGWAPGAIWHNFSATGSGPFLYVNTGTFASATWRRSWSPRWCPRSRTSTTR